MGYSLRLEFRPPHPQPKTLFPTLYSLHPIPDTLHPTPDTGNRRGVNERPPPWDIPEGMNESFTMGGRVQVRERDINRECYLF